MPKGDININAMFFKLKIFQKKCCVLSFSLFIYYEKKKFTAWVLINPYADFVCALITTAYSYTINCLKSNRAAIYSCPVALFMFFKY